MRRSALAALLALATMGLATGCQSPQAKQATRQESKQEQLTRLQHKWNALEATNQRDCPLDPKTQKDPNTPKCNAEAQKERELFATIKQVQAEIANE